MSAALVPKLRLGTHIAKLRFALRRRPGLSRETEFRELRSQTEFGNEGPTCMTSIDLQEVRKVYANGVVALDGVTLAVAAGQCLALVGPSGCGKTTLLRVIAGLEPIDSGTVRLGQRVVNDIPAHRRDVAMLFQRPALVP